MKRLSLTCPFTEENPTTLTTLIERVQVLESRVNNLEPSNSTLHSSISSAPLESPDDHKRKEGLTNEPSSSSASERPTVPVTHIFTMYLMTENKKLQARVYALEESRVGTRVNHVVDRLDNVIKVVNNQAAENYHLDQSVQDLQQELTTLRQTVDSWTDEQQNDEEEQQEITIQDDLPDPPLNEDQGPSNDPPPGLSRSPSMAGSATTIILSSLEPPLVKGSKRVFVRDAHLFMIGKYVVIDRWSVSQIMGKGSIFIDDPSPTDFQ